MCLHRHIFRRSFDRECTLRHVQRTAIETVAGTVLTPEEESVIAGGEVTTKRTAEDAQLGAFNLYGRLSNGRWRRYCAVTWA